MNFIKKKLKTHKKDDEEEEYEKAVAEQSLRPMEQKHKNTEEWQFFQQLSMKVQDTVQKTQTTLNKLKDVRQDSIGGSDFYDIGSESSMQDYATESDAAFGIGKVPGAPPRPPPPSAGKAEPDLDFTSISQTRGPPRPPPPVPADKDPHADLFSDSFMQSYPPKSSPARPPPPSAAKIASPADDFGFGQPSTQTASQPSSDLSFSLLDEFGFQTTAAAPASTSTKGDFQDLLFLDEKEDVDPFDTSFVDVNKIVLHSDAEKASNPFASSSSSFPQNKKKDEFESSASKKQVTNPFFVASESKSSVEPQGVNASLWSSHNPFSDNKVSTDRDNLMGDDLLLGDIVLSDQSSIIADTFKKNEISLVSSIVKNDEPAMNGISSASDTLNLDDILCVAPVEEPVPLQINERKASKPDEFLSGWPEENSNIAHPTQDVLKRGSVTGELDFFSDSISATVESHFEGNQSLSGSRKSSAGETKSVTSKADILDLYNSSNVIDKPILPLSDQLNYAAGMNGDKKTDFTHEVLQPKLESPIHPVMEPIQPTLESPMQLESQPVMAVESELPMHPEPETPVHPDPETPVNLEPEAPMNQTMESPLHPNWDSPVEPRFDSPPHYNVTEAEQVQTEDIQNNSLQEKLSLNESEFPENENAPADSITHDEEPPEQNEEEVAQVLKSSFFGDDQTFAFQETNAKIPDPDFDAFALKFDNVKESNSQNDFYDPFAGGRAPTLKQIAQTNRGFDSMDEFDPFKAPRVTEPLKPMKKDLSRDSFDEYDNEADFSVVIKPKVKDVDSSQHLSSEPPKLLPPPPKTPTKAFDSTSPRFNPFDKDSVMGGLPQTLDLEKTVEPEIEEEAVPALGEASVRKSDSVESPLSPLFDEDTSMPLEEFPKRFTEEGWEMVLRQPNKKKLTGNRFWKKIFVKLSDNSVLQLFNKSDDKLPFQELPLQACYSLSEVGAQQYDQYGKIFTVKLQYKFYRERVGVRPGQISKVTQGQVTSMGDVARLGLPLQHAAQTSQLLKIGTHSYPDIKIFIQEVEDALFKMVIHRDRVLTYKTEEVQVIAQDEFYVEQTKTGHVEKQLARVRIFFLAFITGMPNVEVGLNDINRQGKEVVGRYDIIPVVTEEWIRLEDVEFHSCIMQDEFKNTRIIKFIPPDACLFELLRFRIRPPRNRELPLQVRVFMTVTNTRVEIRSDILVPGYSSRKQGQVPCENIQIRFPIPECWIYLFRTEKHFRYGSKKSTARRPGKIKGLERIIGAAQNLDPSLIEVSAGQAKYEHVFHAVVWRIPRLPKEGQGAYTQQLFLLRTELTSFDQIPETFEQYVDVEFTMPATYVSHTTVRSVSVSNSTPPEKYVRYVSKHEYKVEIDFKSGDEVEGLMSATPSIPTTTAPVQESTEDEKEEEEDSD